MGGWKWANLLLLCAIIIQGGNEFEGLVWLMHSWSAVSLAPIEPFNARHHSCAAINVLFYVGQLVHPHTLQCNPDIIEMLKRTLRCIRAEPIWIVHTALVNLLQILCLNICNKMHCCINLPYLSWSKSWNELFQYHARQFCAKVKCSFGMKVLLRRSRINFRI